MRRCRPLLTKRCRFAPRDSLTSFPPPSTSALILATKVTVTSSPSAYRRPSSHVVESTSQPTMSNES